MSNNSSCVPATSLPRRSTDTVLPSSFNFAIRVVCSLESGARSCAACAEPRKASLAPIIAVTPLPPMALALLVAGILLGGFAVLQFYYAKPFQRPEEDWVTGFVIAPGW